MLQIQHFYVHTNNQLKQQERLRRDRSRQVSIRLQYRLRTIVISKMKKKRSQDLIPSAVDASECGGADRLKETLGSNPRFFHGLGRGTC